jgi:hypothetical protein
VIGFLAVAAIFYLDKRYRKKGYLLWKPAQPEMLDVSRVKPISLTLKRMVDTIVPSVDLGKKLYPCAIRLDTGQELPCVYFIDAEEHFGVNGKLPKSYYEHSIPIENIVSVFISPFRLPQELADELYRQGESAMGAFMFTVEFSNGDQYSYSTGSWVDFIELPPGIRASDATKVIPHKLLSKKKKSVKKYYWCIYRN